MINKTKTKLGAMLTAAALLTAAMPMVIMPTTVSAAEIVDSGTCGENVTWTLDDEGTLTISGSGAMTDYSSYYGSPFYRESSIKSVVIENGVTSIGDYAFYICGLTSITIPDSVTNIGDSAFKSCSELTSITIPDSVTSIGNAVFEFCSILTDIFVDSENDYYSSYDGVLFNKDKTLLVEYPYGKGKVNASYTIPDSVTSIDNYAFSHCNQLQSITIPDSVTSIGDYAFYLCSMIRSITIPDSVTSIGDCAFDNCQRLTSITIPDSVTSIGNEAFVNCLSLTEISVDSENDYYSSENGVLFNKDKTLLIHYP